MNTDKALKKHIVLEFILHNSMLILETRGVINNINSIVETFGNIVMPQIKYSFEKNKITTKIYTEKSLPNNLNTFFENFKLIIKVIPNTDKNYSGEFQPYSVKKVNGKWIVAPEINMIVSGKDIYECGNTFGIGIGHELTHAYDFWQYAIKNNKHPLNSILNNKYDNISNARNNIIDTNNLRAVADMLYALNKMERNAYIAQLKQELNANKDKIKDIKSVYNLIYKSSSYQKFKSLENNISFIMALNYIPTQNGIIESLNKVMETKFTTWNQVKKYFIRRWYKWKNAYLTKAVKIAYDVYYENNIMINDINMSKKITPLKII